MDEKLIFNTSSSYWKRILMVEFDVLIENASIIDGTGKKEYKGSIGVKADKVNAVGDVKGDAVRTIDAKGLKALPGFIDAHSHAERMLLFYPLAQSHIMQGITTFVGGQCGGSPAPIAEKMSLPGLLSDYMMEFAPYKYRPENRKFPFEQVNGWMKEKFGWTIDYRTMGEFFETVEAKGVSINYAPLVGHGSIRSAVMGDDYKRHSTPEERSAMHEYIHQAMKEGCIGMSTGMDYDPDVFASRDEITEAVAQLKEYGGIYCPHWFRTGRRIGVTASTPVPDRIQGILDEVETHKATGVRLHFAHLTTGWDVRPRPPNSIAKSVLEATFDATVGEAKDPLDITWDAIPFMVRGGFSVMPYLCSSLAPWLRELGSREALGEWLKVKDFREEIKDAFKAGKLYVRASNPYINPKFAEGIIVLKSKSPGLDGKTLAQIAAERENDPVDTWFDIIAEDPDTRGVTSMMMNEKNYYMYYKHPSGMLGLDTVFYDDKRESPEPTRSIPGINYYSGFPIIYDRFVKKEKVLTLQEAVQATSTRAAKVHNLEGRGVIAEGGYADIVLMDYENLEIRSTELETRQHPGGIEYVLVNGVPVVEGGKHTGATPGRVLRRA